MDVRLDDDAMKQIIQKSILESLTPERREAIIGQAVTNLLKTDTGNSYDRRSQLQRIFDDAAKAGRHVTEACGIERGEHGCPPSLSAQYSAQLR